jgi:hypothetical protein
MSDQVQFVVQITIAEGGLEKFKELAKAAADTVEAQEPGTIAYRWYFSEDQTQCYVLEWYKSADLIPGHMECVGPILVEMGAVSHVTRFEVFGNVSEEIRAAMAPLGAKFLGYSHGFTRLPA